MDFKYYANNIELQVCFGMLNKNIELIEEVNKLYWISINENFFDKNKYAGESNIGHMLEQVKLYREKNN